MHVLGQKIYFSDIAYTVAQTFYSGYVCTVKQKQKVFRCIYLLKFLELPTLVSQVCLQNQETKLHAFHQDKLEHGKQI